MLAAGSGPSTRSRICAERAGLVDLVLVDREVLAQHRNFDDGAGRAQVVVVPLKVAFVGQHGQARRAVRRVARGDGFDVELLAYQPFAG